MQNDREIKSKVVETYAEDVAKVIQDDKSGLVKKIIHGEEEHEKEKQNLSPESTKNTIFIVLSLLFIILGAGTLFYFFDKKEVPTVSIEKQFTPLIFNDKSTFFEVKDLTKNEIMQTVLNEVTETEVKTGGVEGIYLTENKQTVGLRRFTAISGGSFVTESVDLVYDNFLMGVANTDSKDFFILLKMRSIADIFPSLRAWEGKMFADLHGFFPSMNISADTQYLLTKNFEDGVIENKNARILYDKDGKIALMYIFADENSVVITNTESAAHEIMLRLAASQVKK